MRTPSREMMSRIFRENIFMSPFPSFEIPKINGLRTNTDSSSIIDGEYLLESSLHPAPASSWLDFRYKEKKKSGRGGKSKSGNNRNDVVFILLCRGLQCKEVRVVFTQLSRKYRHLYFDTNGEFCFGLFHVQFVLVPIDHTRHFLSHAPIFKLHHLMDRNLTRLIHLLRPNNNNDNSNSDSNSNRNSSRFLSLYYSIIERVFQNDGEFIVIRLSTLIDRKEQQKLSPTNWKYVATRIVKNSINETEQEEEETERVNDISIAFIIEECQDQYDRHIKTSTASKDNNWNSNRKSTINGNDANIFIGEERGNKEKCIVIILLRRINIYKEENYIIDPNINDVEFPFLQTLSRLINKRQHEQDDQNVNSISLIDGERLLIIPIPKLSNQNNHSNTDSIVSLDDDLKKEAQERNDEIVLVLSLALLSKHTNDYNKNNIGTSVFVLLSKRINCNKGECDDEHIIINSVLSQEELRDKNSISHNENNDNDRNVNSTNIDSDNMNDNDGVTTLLLLSKCSAKEHSDENSISGKDNYNSTVHDNINEKVSIVNDDDKENNCDRTVQMNRDNTNTDYVVVYSITDSTTGCIVILVLRRTNAIDNNGDNCNNCIHSIGYNYNNDHDRNARAICNDIEKKAIVYHIISTHNDSNNCINANDINKQNVISVSLIDGECVLIILLSKLSKDTIRNKEDLDHANIIDINGREKYTINPNNYFSEISINDNKECIDFVLIVLSKVSNHILTTIRSETRTACNNTGCTIQRDSNNDDDDAFVMEITKYNDNNDHDRNVQSTSIIDGNDTNDNTTSALILISRLLNRIDRGNEDIIGNSNKMNVNDQVSLLLLLLLNRNSCHDREKISSNGKRYIDYALIMLSDLSNCNDDDYNNVSVPIIPVLSSNPNSNKDCNDNERNRNHKECIFVCVDSVLLPLSKLLSNHKDDNNNNTSVALINEKCIDYISILLSELSNHKDDNNNNGLFMGSVWTPLFCLIITMRSSTELTTCTLGNKYDIILKALFVFYCSILYWIFAIDGEYQNLQRVRILVDNISLYESSWNRALRLESYLSSSKQQQAAKRGEMSQILHVM